jgi:hypothetical protein
MVDGDQSIGGDWRKFSSIKKIPYGSCEFDIQFGFTYQFSIPSKKGDVDHLCELQLNLSSPEG